MRRGLMLWREDELSEADVLARQHRLQAAMDKNGLDAVLVYTNHVRSAGVTYLTGFTPYWSDALLLVPRQGQVVFATALSKRVGKWIRSTNPTAAVIHSPHPGRMVGERLAGMGARNVGVVERDRMPGGLIAEIVSESNAQLTDATAVFAAVRALPDAAELALAVKADAIAAQAYTAAPDAARLVGEVTEALELKVREAGAEECYVAAAPNLTEDRRLARIKAGTALGKYFAVRLSVAYNGVWVRRTESFARAGDDTVTEAARVANRLAAAIDLSAPLKSQISAQALPEGMTVAHWTLEAPVATRPLQPVASPSRHEMRAVPYGVLTLTINVGSVPLVFARPVGLSHAAARERSAA